MSSWPKDGKPKAARSKPPDQDPRTGNAAPGDQTQRLEGPRPEIADDAEPVDPVILIVDQADCVAQLFAAACDIAERDDIHQAAERLALVLDWIRREAALAAADPIFRPLRLAS